MSRKTTVQSVSFQPDVWKFLENKKISTIVNEALREYRKNRTTPEQKIKLLKQQKRELIKKINQMDEEIKSLKG